MTSHSWKRGINKQQLGKESEHTAVVHKTALKDEVDQGVKGVPHKEGAQAWGGVLREDQAGEAQGGGEEDSGAG